MPVDVSCSNCGREPTHPQVRHRFTYAAYYHAAATLGADRRCYIAALCDGCYDHDRERGTGAARNRFLRRVSAWSAQPINETRVVILVDHPESATGEEWESDISFVGGVAARRVAVNQA